MSETVELKVRAPVELRSRLDALAEAFDQPRSWVLEQAIEAFAQAEDIRQALREADVGDFATDDEVAEAFARLAKPRRNAG